MRVLVVKLTSMGDVLHILPALSDLTKRHPEAVVDWMVEDSFAEIPHWHKSVDRVIKVSTRRWRSLRWSNVSEFLSFVKELRAFEYDYVIDAQGLMKSAVFARFAKLHKSGKLIGYSGDSIKESPAAYLYKQKVAVKRQQHAVPRLRHLFAGGFNYELASDELEYGLRYLNPKQENLNTIFLFHGTTWSSKHVPDQLWRDLCDCIAADGYRIKLCWGNEQERQRAEWIAQDRAAAQILPKSSLSELRDEIASSAGAIAVDTGLGHMAAALGTPCVSLYGATDAQLTGTAGEKQSHWQSDYHCSPCLLKQCDKLSEEIRQPPCYQTLIARELWQQLRAQID